MSNKGITWSDERREKYYKSEAVQEKMRKFYEMSKQPKSELQRERMSQAKKGRKFTDEHRAAMSQSHKARQILKNRLQEENPDWDESTTWKKIREMKSEAKKSSALQSTKDECD